MNGMGEPAGGRPTPDPPHARDRRVVASPARRTGIGGERGSATVMGVAAVLVVLVVFVGAVHFGAVVVTRHRVAAAADLAALAAAAHAVDGTDQACATARRVTDRMVVRLSACELDGWDAIVQVEAPPPGPLDRFGTARATARAGPAPLVVVENARPRRAVVRQR
jgi:secretion/DNA translocation related TadE-like protein